MQFWKNRYLTAVNLVRICVPIHLYSTYVYTGVQQVDRQLLYGVKASCYLHENVLLGVQGNSNTKIDLNTDKLRQTTLLYKLVKMIEATGLADSIIIDDLGKYLHKPE